MTTLRTIRDMPFFPLIPLLPAAILIASFATSLRAFRLARHLERQLAGV